jgi:hypothetical protein
MKQSINDIIVGINDALMMLRNELIGRGNRIAELEKLIEDSKNEKPKANKQDNPAS